MTYRVYRLTEDGSAWELAGEYEATLKQILSWDWNTSIQVEHTEGGMTTIDAWRDPGEPD